MVEKSEKTTLCDAKLQKSRGFLGERLSEPKRDASVVNDLGAEQAPHRIRDGCVVVLNFARIHRRHGSHDNATLKDGVTDPRLSARRCLHWVSSAHRDRDGDRRDLELAR
jgi:hypothetical protein